MDWIIKEDGDNVSYIKPGYELDQFEISPSGNMYSVKVALKQADCIYTTRFADLDKARRFMEYHLQTYLDSFTDS
jgi:hypothetical protein